MCYLVRMLAEEHAAGEHDAAVNASCIDCTRAPAYVEELRRHRDAMRRTEDTQAAMRARREHLYGNGIKPERLVKKTSLEVKAFYETQIDHSQCDHERTAKARATCRRAKRAV